jgi:hypothetical protein
MLKGHKSLVDGKYDNDDQARDKCSKNKRI